MSSFWGYGILKKLGFETKNFLKKNRFLIFFAAALFLCGTVFGGVCICRADSKISGELANEARSYFSVMTLQPADKKQLFSSGFLSAVKCELFFVLSIVFSFALPFAAVRFFAEGFKTGGFIAFFSRLYGAKGAFFAFIVHGFRLWFFVPVLILLFACGVKNLIERRLRRSKPKNYNFLYASAIFLSIFAAALTSLAESLFVPVVLNFCGFLQ